MLKFIFLFLTFLYLISCMTKDNRPCHYKLNDLMNTDSARVYASYKEDGVILEVRDKGIDSSLGPAYSFDVRGNLRLYAFLISKNKYGYLEEYDSLGDLLKIEGIPIVQKILYKKSMDSVEFTYFFFSLNKKYENLEIFTNKKDTIHSEMFKNNHFTNMKSTSFILPLTSKTIQTLVIYTNGDIINLCNNSKEHFSDTAFFKNVKL